VTIKTPFRYIFDTFSNTPAAIASTLCLKFQTKRAYDSPLSEPSPGVPRVSHFPENRPDASRPRWMPPKHVPATPHQRKELPCTSFSMRSSS
jgi:hypothetical protein